MTVSGKLQPRPAKACYRLLRGHLACSPTFCVCGDALSLTADQVACRESWTVSLLRHLPRSKARSSLLSSVLLTSLSESVR